MQSDEIKALFHRCFELGKAYNELTAAAREEERADAKAGDDLLEAWDPREMVQMHKNDIWPEVCDLRNQVFDLIKEARLSPLANRIMRSRYIRCLSWRSICRELGKTKGYVYNIHRSSLNQIARGGKR